jgi:hypothetical protein
MSIRIPIEVSLRMLIYMVTYRMFPPTRSSPARLPQEGRPPFASEEPRKTRRAARTIRQQAKRSISAPVHTLQSMRRARRMPHNRPLLCFHIDTNPFCPNSLELTLMRTARGVWGSRPIIVSHGHASSLALKPNVLTESAQTRGRGGNSLRERFVLVPKVRCGQEGEEKQVPHRVRDDRKPEGRPTRRTHCSSGLQT